MQSIISTLGDKREQHFRPLFLSVFLLVLLFKTAVIANPRSGKIFIQPDCELIFAEIETGQKILTEPDMFTQALSPYTKASTLKTTDPVTTEEYLNFLKQQVRPWNELEKEMVRWAARELYPKLKPYRLHLPEKIYLIKTTGKDMAGCAYCRYCSIVFPEDMIFPLGTQFESLVTHELFHVYSRYNLDLRTELYSLIGFKPCNEIELPESIANRELVNPDAPLNNYYLEIPYQDQNDLPVLPMMLSHQLSYDPNLPDFGLGGMGETKLVALEQQDGRWGCRLENGEPVILNLGQATGYFKQVGLNTTYVLGAEEVLAENFTLLILKHKKPVSPEIPEKLNTFLMKHRSPTPPQPPSNIIITASSVPLK